jgi:hypothetical protein
LHFWARSAVFSEIVRKLLTCQSASGDALPVMLCRPLGGLRCDHRERVKQTEHIRSRLLVQDNLSIHSKASLYEAFPAVEARRLVERFEWHYTPKHGSWLDLAESELGVLTSQCLNRRIPNKQILIEEIASWEHDRNANHTKADWQFTTQNARIIAGGTHRHSHYVTPKSRI